jgi:hypothetical protein
MYIPSIMQAPCMNSLLNVLFPPLCTICGEKTNLKYLCKNCWEESSLIDLETRCRHCFRECQDRRLCITCSRNPTFPFERAGVFETDSPLRSLLHEDKVHAAAAFAYYQWQKLEWDEPDLIASIPPDRPTVAHAFAEICQKPCPKLFSRTGLTSRTEEWKLKSHLFDESTTLLLFDSGCNWQQLRMISRELISAFPKKVYCLSLFA